MARKLPPLNALRAFEAAARHLSFTRAADELHVTQAAISHQVKGLEEYLGMQLFKRLNRALLLTEDGQKYFPDVRDSLDQIAKATEQILKSDTNGVLTVSVTPSMASLWMVPRVQDFMKIHEDIDVRIAADDKLVDFDHDDVDVAIRYGRGNWPGIFFEKIMEEEVFPVCSARYLEDHPELDKPENLIGHTLIHDYMIRGHYHLTWGKWAEFFNLKELDPTRGPKFSHTHMAIQACLAGEGVALGRSTLIEDDLETGRLVKLFDVSVSSDWSYYFCCNQDSKDRYKNRVFLEWLKQICPKPMANGAAI